MIEVRVEVTSWTATDKELRIRAEIPTFSAQTTFLRRKNSDGSWAWSREYGGNRQDPDVEEIATSIVVDHSILSRLIDFYDITPLPEPTELHLIERDLRAS